MTNHAVLRLSGDSVAKIELEDGLAQARNRQEIASRHKRWRGGERQRLLFFAQAMVRSERPGGSANDKSSKGMKKLRMCKLNQQTIGGKQSRKR